jgi:putative transposon-encoded protein
MEVTKKNLYPNVKVQTKKEVKKPDEEALKKYIELGEGLVAVYKKVKGIKENLEAEAILDDKEIKKFGSFGAHIIVPSKFIGKKTKVIIKK